MKIKSGIPYARWLKSYLRGPQWPEEGTLIGVLWCDATYAEDIENSGTAMALTFGIVVEATTDHIKIAAEIFEDKTVRDVSTIPAGMVRSVQRFAGIGFEVQAAGTVATRKRKQKPMPDRP